MNNQNVDQNEIAKFEAAADKFGMALLAPQGIGHSFNAPHCCGPARDRRRSWPGNRAPPPSVWPSG